MPVPDDITWTLRLEADTLDAALADGDQITLWVDQSPNNIHWDGNGEVKPRFRADALCGHDVVHIHTEAGEVDFNAFSHNNGDLFSPSGACLFAVIKVIASTQAVPRVAAGGWSSYSGSDIFNGNGKPDFVLCVGQDPDTSEQLIAVVADQRIGASTYANAGVAARVPNQLSRWEVIEARFDGGAIYIRSNYEAEVSAPVSFAMNPNTNDNFMLIGRASASSDIEMQLAALYVADNPLTIAERDAMMEYLVDEYTCGAVLRPRSFVGAFV